MLQRSICTCIPKSRSKNKYLDCRNLLYWTILWSLIAAVVGRKNKYLSQVWSANLEALCGNYRCHSMLLKSAYPNVTWLLVKFVLLNEFTGIWLRIQTNQSQCMTFCSGTRKNWLISSLNSTQIVQKTNNLTMKKLT